MLRKRKTYTDWKKPIDPGPNVVEKEIKKIYRFPRNYKESLRIINRFAIVHGYDGIVDFLENGVGIAPSTFYKTHKARTIKPEIILKISRLLNLPTRLFTCRKWYGRYWKWAKPLRPRFPNRGRKMKRYYNVENIPPVRPPKFNVKGLLPDVELEQDRKVSDTHWTDQIK